MRSAEVDRIRRLIERAGLPTRARLGERQQQALLTAMQHDKKVSAGEVRFVLAKRIGEVVIGQSVPRALILESLRRQPSTLNPQPSTQ